jgi:hypothetical protein
LFFVCEKTLVQIIFYWDFDGDAWYFFEFSFIWLEVLGESYGKSFDHSMEVLSGLQGK